MVVQRFASRRRAFPFDAWIRLHLFAQRFAGAVNECALWNSQTNISDLLVTVQAIWSPYVSGFQTLFRSNKEPDDVCHSPQVSSEPVSAGDSSSVLCSRLGTMGAGRRAWMLRFPAGGGESRGVTTTWRAGFGSAPFVALEDRLLSSSSFRSFCLYGISAPVPNHFKPQILDTRTASVARSMFQLTPAGALICQQEL